MRKIETAQLALGESKSGRIVVNEIACLRAVRGNRATLFFESRVIEADPEPTERVNLGRGWKRRSPNDILEQPEFALRDAEPHGRSDRTPRDRSEDRVAS